MIPTTIHKHWFGYLVIFLAGGLLIAALWVAIVGLWQAGFLSVTLYYFIGAVSVIVLLIMLVEAYVYSLSFLELTPDNLIVNNWVTLFADKDESTEWARVSRATAVKGGIFAQVFNFGTLSIETNGGNVQVSITMIPNVEHWQQIIQAKADESTIDGAP